LIAFGFLASSISFIIEGMEIIGALLSFLGFVLVIHVLYYSHRKKQNSTHLKEDERVERA